MSAKRRVGETPVTKRRVGELSITGAALPNYRTSVSLEIKLDALRRASTAVVIDTRLNVIKHDRLSLSRFTMPTTMHFVRVLVKAKSMPLKARRNTLNILHKLLRTEYTAVA